jgi:hypothetical protein
MEYIATIFLKKDNILMLFVNEEFSPAGQVGMAALPHSDLLAQRQTTHYSFSPS